MASIKESALKLVLKARDTLSRPVQQSGAVRSHHCGSNHIKKNGHDTVQTDCQHYQCKHCSRYFDDLTNTVFAGHHQPLKVWVSCLYLKGLSVSNSQIAKELDLCTSDVHAMTTLFVKRKPDITLEGEVEFDEFYIVAGHIAVCKPIRASTTISS